MHSRHVFLVGIVAQQPVVKHPARDGGGVRSAETGVFHDGRNHDGGVFGRSKGGKQRVVTLVFFQRLGVVFDVLPQANGLGRARFATRAVRRTGKHTPSRARFVHGDQTPQNHLNVFGGKAQVVAWWLLDGGDLSCDCIAHRLANMGPVANASVDQGSLGQRQLQHGEVVVTLTNAQ